LSKADDLVALWSRLYGRDLSNDDLDQILAYYTSSVGRKDVAASHSAMAEFAATTGAEAQRRIRAAAEQLTTDLKALADSTPK
jgi:hypothetical protein